MTVADPPRPIAVLALTHHGVALAGRVLAALPAARLYVPAALADAAGASAPGRHEAYAGSTRDLLAGLFPACDGIVAIFALGALVRLLAPLLRDKYQDPAVLALDEAGRFVIPVLSGHLGGANALAATLAERLGATAVLTTASDVQQGLAADLLGRELGWQLQAAPGALLRASAALVNGEPVALVQEAGSSDWWRRHANGRDRPPPAHLERLDRGRLRAGGPWRALLWISREPPPPEIAGRFAGALVHYLPLRSDDREDREPASESLPPRPDEGQDRAPASEPQPESAAGPGPPPGPSGPAPITPVRVALGLGCDRGTATTTLARVVDEALARLGLNPNQVALAASIDLKADEPGLLALAAARDWPLRYYPAALLAAVPVPNPSETVRRHTGTPSVSEAAALLAAWEAIDHGQPGAGPTDAAALLLEKHRIRDADGRHATVSIARIIDDRRPRDR